MIDPAEYAIDYRPVTNQDGALMLAEADDDTREFYRLMTECLRDQFGHGDGKARARMLAFIERTKRHG